MGSGAMLGSPELGWLPTVPPAPAVAGPLALPGAEPAPTAASEPDDPGVAKGGGGMAKLKRRCLLALAGLGGIAALSAEARPAEAAGGGGDGEGEDDTCRAASLPPAAAVASMRLLSGLASLPLPSAFATALLPAPALFRWSIAE